MPDEDTAPVALVTGGARRVGASIVRALAQAGYRVWIHHHASQAAARTLAQDLGAARAVPIRCDLSDPRARGALVDAVAGPAGPFGGRLDLLVNNAASFERGAFERRTDDDLRRVLELNLVAPLSLVRGLLSALRPSPDAERRTAGCVVNILDLGALAPWPGYVDHCAAKAGLANATRALAAALAPVRVNAVAPGTVLWPDDPAFAPGTAARRRIEARIPLRRAGTPEDVARALLYLAQAPYVTGEIHVVDGGRLAAAGVAGRTEA